MKVNRTGSEAESTTALSNSASRQPESEVTYWKALISGTNEGLDFLPPDLDFLRFGLEFLPAGLEFLRTRLEILLSGMERRPLSPLFPTVREV